MVRIPLAKRWLIPLLATTVLLGTLACEALLSNAGAQSSSRPNVVLLLTDDQTLDEMQGLPQTQALIGGQGTTFSRAYISYPLCCPSRAAILTGQYMHNNGVQGNSPPNGGWQKFRDQGLEQRDLPNWLQNSGYYNVQIGKYLNGYGGSPAPVPPGWNEWYGKYSEYDPSVYGNKLYYNYTMREDPPVTGGPTCPSGGPTTPGQPFDCHYGQDPADYQTDVLGDMALNAVRRLSGPVNAHTPFFLNVDFNAPHPPYVPAPRDIGTLSGVQLPTDPSTNEKNVSDKPFFLRRLPKLRNGTLNKLAQRRRTRLEMLRSVDGVVAAIVNALQQQGQLQNTYLIFMSDNGYFAGEHRIRQGKYLPHDPSSHVPLMIRGPGIPAGGVSSELVSNVDVASTIAQMAGASPAINQDGRSLLPLAQNPNLRSGRPILFEGNTGPSIDDEGGEGPGSSSSSSADLRAFLKKLKKEKRKLRKRCNRLKRTSPKRATLCFRQGVKNIEQEPIDSAYKLQAPAYIGMRTDRYAIFLYSTGEVELYDMQRDPYQLSSVSKNRRYRDVRKALLTEVNALSTCSSGGCQQGLGPDPAPLTKKQLKARKKKGNAAPKRR